MQKISMKSKKLKKEVSDTDAAEEVNSELNNFSPEDFITKNQKISTLSLNLVKKLYDYTKSQESQQSLDDPLGLNTEVLKTPITATVAKKKKKKHRQGTISKAEAPIQSLITNDFDQDQIWEELELQNKFIYDNLVTSVSRLLAFQRRVVEQEDSDVNDSSEEDKEEVNRADKFQDDDTGEEDEDSDFFESDEKYRKKSNKQGGDDVRYPKSVVDDQFFSLAQMTEHIEQLEADMEKASTKKSQGSQDDEEEDEESSGEESIDLFEEIPSEDDVGDGNKDNKSAYYYKDFFDPPLRNEAEIPDNDENTEQDGSEKDQEEDQEKESDEDEERSIKQEEESEQDLDDDDQEAFKSVRFNLEDDEDGGDVDEDEDFKGEIKEEEEEDLKQKIKETLSSFEKRKKKIEENIEEIESQAMEPKSWHLLGEATAESRPENALLEEHLIYDHLIRPAPEITMETTMKLEDVIKQRIKDGAWDDVLRKVRPVEDPREYKKRMVLDAEKSKSSLAEIYEKEYLDQKKTEDGDVEEKEPEEHNQIRQEMKKLFGKLDALCHFHFTPKAPTAEVKIVSNTPSMSIEETAGVSLSAANMLAPQEIQDNVKGHIKGKGERSTTDKKRERRKKKKKQHLKRLKQEETARLKGLGLRNIKLAEGIIKQNAKKSAAGVQGYSTNQQSAKELKSSKAFFTKLQEGATAHINKVAKRKNMPKETNSSPKFSAKKFKL